MSKKKHFNSEEEREAYEISFYEKKKVDSKIYHKNNKEEIKVKGKEYRENNKEKLKVKEKKYRETHKEQIKEYRENNKEQIKAKNKEYKEKNKEDIKIKNKEYNKNHKDQRKEYIKNRKLTNPAFKLKCSISSQIAKALKRSKGSKNGNSCLKFLPKDYIKQLEKHLEDQFEEWMTWENHGIYIEGGPRKWHIDHIIPQSAFDYDTMDHPNFQKCWALENLQPLDAQENLKKSNKLY